MCSFVRMLCFSSEEEFICIVADRELNFYSVYFFILCLSDALLLCLIKHEFSNMLADISHRFCWEIAWRILFLTDTEVLYISDTSRKILKVYSWSASNQLTNLILFDNSLFLNDFKNYQNQPIPSSINYKNFYAIFKSPSFYNSSYFFQALWNVIIVETYLFYAKLRSNVEFNVWYQELSSQNASELYYCSNFHFERS